MRLLDDIVSRTDTTIVCRKTFDADEYFLQGHFPESPIVPGVIQCECCLQAGAVLLASSSASSSSSSSSSMADGVPVATRMDGVKFKRMVRPGDAVEVHVTLKERVGPACYMTGKILLDGKVASRLDFVCSVAKPVKPPKMDSARPRKSGVRS
jgi:3-hydroxyacyl-[acyl-carrier-protein] dehydratase